MVEWRTADVVQPVRSDREQRIANEQGGAMGNEQGTRSSKEGINAKKEQGAANNTKKESSE